MSIDWSSFFIGGAVILFGFLAIMAWIVPDKASTKATSWLVSRRNFSGVGIGIGIILIVGFLVVISNAIVKLLHYVQVDTWVWVAAVTGLMFLVISIIVLLVTRKKSVS